MFGRYADYGTSESYLVPTAKEKVRRLYNFVLLLHPKAQFHPEIIA